MQLKERKIIFQGKQRLVEGVAINRDADFAILFEKRHFVEIIKKAFNVKKEHIDEYEGWDRDVIHIVLPSGAIVALSAAQGAGFSASAIERYIRSGVSHIIRIGTCGSLNSHVNTWDIIINKLSVSADSTSACYKDHKRNFLRALLDELLCPLGCMYYIYENWPTAIKWLLKKMNRKYYEYYSCNSNSELNNALEKELISLAGKDAFILHKTNNYTISARFLENNKIIKSILKDIDISTIDMETASIFNCCNHHKIPASSINVVIDSPLDTMSDKQQEDQYYSKNLKSRYYGIPNHQKYHAIIPEKIIFCTKAALNVFEKYATGERFKN